MRPDEDKNLAIRTYGHRIFESQTLPEYLIEFALVFLAGREVGVDPELGGPGKFPTRPVEDGELEYITDTRIGLKRFIFFERSKQEHRLDLDRYAYEEIRKLIEERVYIEQDDLTPSDVVDIVQELLYGFNAVLLNRSWFVQSLLPICPELVFPEAMRRGVKRASASQRSQEVPQIQGAYEVDNDFDFNGYYFHARGGEVYYLHVLEGLIQEPDLRPDIENGLRELFDSRHELSRLARWIQDMWDRYMKVENKPVKKACRWIPPDYASRAKYTCRELRNFLNSRMEQLRKIQLLSIGIVLQILRMMHDRAGALKNQSAPRPAWIIHVPGCVSADVKSLAARSYQQCEDDLLGALYTQKPPEVSPKELEELISKASRNAHLLFRKLGKAAQLVVPPRGPHTRFSLSEDLVKFLVMALIPPGEKILLTEFLSILYEHFGMIIGPTELESYIKHVNDRSRIIEDATLMRENENAFKELLKACGFLRDLSDATAIVENPFGGVA